MKFTSKEIEELRSILAVCKVIEVQGLVIYEGMARGAKPSMDSAIISSHTLPISPELKLGIGNVAELEKRLSIFPEATLEGKVREGTEDVGLLTIVQGKTKMQFRGTSVSMIRYPKENIDPPAATILLSKAEVSQISAAVKALKSTHVVLQLTNKNSARIESVDANNDKFEIELSEDVKYEGDETSFVFNYIAGMFINVLDNVSRETETVSLTVGEAGSITAKLKGHTIMIMAQITGEEDDF